MILGNIVTNNTITDVADFNVVKSMDDIIHGLPTLIIGWKLSINLFPDLDVVNRTAGENIYWTFAMNEKREYYEIDLFMFRQRCYQDLISKVTYFFVDLFTLRISKIKRLINKINSTNKGVIYKHDNILYIYIDKLILGINLEFCEYFNVNITKLINKLKSKNFVFLEKETIFIMYMNRIKFIDFQVKYIPYLYAIDYEKDDITSNIFR